jgi:hypothetical protein
MNTTENNKLIVQFMQLKPTKVNTDFYALAKNHVHITGKNPEIVISGFSECAKYNSDWNWLMELVEKIENYNEFTNVLFAPQGCAINCYIKNGFSFSNDCETKIEAVYNACVEFIKWHNEQKIN